MKTPFDWITIALFAGLVVLFLQRSAMERPTDRLWQYAPPAVGCALVNYIGNEGYTLVAIAGLAVVVSYIFLVLKPHIVT